MRRNSMVRAAAVGCVAALIAHAAGAANVKVTPLSGKTMEFDANGRCVAGC